jgi:hypothetical protein
MDLASLVEAFARWSQGRGLVTREVDRARVARELLELAGDAELTEDHIEALAKRYRDGLMGARTVLAARRVGQEMLEWQDDAEDGRARARAVAAACPATTAPQGAFLGASAAARALPVAAPRFLVAAALLCPAPLVAARALADSASLVAAAARVAAPASGSIDDADQPRAAKARHRTASPRAARRRLG